jgi:glycine/D-amino acid oxidase-like deaminating enzyme
MPSPPKHRPFAHHGTLPIWLADDQATPSPVLDRHVDVDVAIIGAGIAGITTALLLQRDGARVAVIERHRVAGGATGYTTAKVSALQQTAYTDVHRYHGASGARAYAAASLAALDLIAGFVAEGIDCAWERLPAFLYAADDSQVSAVRDEAVIAQAAGLAVELTGDVPLPFTVSLAARLEDQAQLNPVRYVRGLADRLTAAGGLIFEGTAVTKVHDGSPCRVETEPGGTVRARDVVVCTNYPMLDRGLFFARTQATRSYLVAARVRGDGPRGMLITAGQPTRSLRSYTGPDGEHWVLVE